MVQRAECPECETQYTLKRLGAEAVIGLRYSVTCATCQTSFDVTFKSRKRLFRLAVIEVVIN